MRREYPATSSETIAASRRWSRAKHPSTERSPYRDIEHAPIAQCTTGRARECPERDGSAGQRPLSAISRYGCIWPFSEVRERPLLQSATGSNGSICDTRDGLGSAENAFKSGSRGQVTEPAVAARLRSPRLAASRYLVSPGNHSEMAGTYVTSSSARHMAP